MTALASPDPVSEEASAGQEPPFTELLADLASEVATLVRQELALAAGEMANKAREAARSTVLMAVGALLGAVSVVVLVAALVLALGNAVPMWASALVVAAVAAVAGLIAFRRGANALRAIKIVPAQTIASLKDDERWVKQQIETTRDQMTTTIGEVRRRFELAPRREEPVEASPTKPRKRRAPTKRKAAS